MAEGCKGMFPDTRGFEGCNDLYATQNLDDPQNFVIVETWESGPAYEKYFAWCAIKGTAIKGTEGLKNNPSVPFISRCW